MLKVNFIRVKKIIIYTQVFLGIHIGIHTFNAFPLTGNQRMSQELLVSIEEKFSVTA